MQRARLDAFLAHAGLGTRSQVKRLIRSGRATVDGAVCRRGATQIDLRASRVCVDGEWVEPPPDFRYAILHKPVGYACSHDPREAPIIDELLPVPWRAIGLEPAGRLDRDSSGLLILSGDGQLIHRITHPGRHLPKRYRVTYSGVLPTDAIARCATGIAIDTEREPTRPAELALEAPGRATLIMREGRFRQVRRMLAALGVIVTALHRDRIGQLDLPADLGPGEVRPLTEPELTALLCADATPG